MRLGTQEVITKFGQIAIHPTMIKCGVVGFVFGAVVGYVDPEPDRLVDLSNAVNTALLATTTTFIKGVSASEAAATVYSLVPNMAVASLVNNIAGGGLYAVSFAIGFSAGYFIGHEVRLLLD